MIAANFSYLGDRKVYRLTPSGPFFTPEHQVFQQTLQASDQGYTLTDDNLEIHNIIQQFYTSVDNGVTAVASREDLFNENPQLRERETSNLADIGKLPKLYGKELRMSDDFNLCEHQGCNSIEILVAPPNLSLIMFGVLRND